MYKMIVVEDDPKIRAGIINIFPWNNIQFEIVGGFSDGLQALDFLERHFEQQPVHVVLTDIRMNHMDGFALAETIRKRYGSQIRIVFLSGYQDYEMMRKALLVEAQDYLTKPVRYEMLLECFERIRTELDQHSSDAAPEDFCAGYYDQIISQAKQYTRQHLRECTLEQVATHVHLSPSYFSRLFRKKCDQAFSDYLLELRLQEAARMLRNPKYKQYEVAFYVGYDIPQNFSRAFKQRYGISPRQYREQNLSPSDSSVPPTKGSAEK